MSRQEQALSRFRGKVPAIHEALREAYAQAAGFEKPELPRLKRLASDSWLPPLR
jgi:hypothetical protein